MRPDSTVAPSPRGTPLRIGQELGPFTILREIGRGSWAIVYDAAHRVSGTSDVFSIWKVTSRPVGSSPG